MDCPSVDRRRWLLMGHNGHAAFQSIAFGLQTPPQEVLDWHFRYHQVAICDYSVSVPCGRIYKDKVVWQLEVSCLPKSPSTYAVHALSNMIDLDANFASF